MWPAKKKRSRTTAINPAYQPNSAEVAHFARKFRQRRRLQRWLVALFLLLPAVLAGSFIYFRESLFRSGSWTEPSVMSAVLVGLLVVAEVAIIALSLANWRCSHCENRAPLRPHPAVCSHCGAKLSLTKTSESDPPP